MSRMRRDRGDTFDLGIRSINYNLDGPIKSTLAELGIAAKSLSHLFIWKFVRMMCSLGKIIFWTFFVSWMQLGKRWKMFQYVCELITNFSDIFKENLELESWNYKRLLLLLQRKKLMLRKKRQKKMCAMICNYQLFENKGIQKNGNIMFRNRRFIDW